MIEQWTQEEFKNPPAEFRGAPFWAWNTKLNIEQLKEQIGYFKEMGMGGYHIHCRVGLDTPYLGEEFLSYVSECVEEGKRQGLYTYLYDEDRWPSGTAGGIVTKEERFRSRHLLFIPKKIAPEENKHRKLLEVYEVELENGHLKTYKRVSKAIEQNLNSTKKYWCLYLEMAEPTPWHNNQTYVDTLNKEAVDRFIQVTHESYNEKVGAKFGKWIPSIFTDEPQFSRKETLNFAEEERPLVLPYTDGFDDFYKDRFTEDFRDTFPEIVWDLPGGKVSAARYQYHEGISELFTESFADTVGVWCESHHLMLTGHMMEEQTLLSQTSALGEAMRSYRSFQQPGIDMLCDWREYTTVKQAQSAAHQYGRPSVASEIYGVTNWDFEFRQHKLQGDWQAALGVTRRIPHLSWVSMEGEAKRDYPASIFYQSPWYKEYKMVEDHFARVNTALMRGKPHVRVGVIHPIESYWIHFGPKEQTSRIRETMEQHFQNVTEWLLFGMIDFDYIAESLLCEQKKEVEKDSIRIGKMQYDVLLVPGCETLRTSTVECLRNFHNAGGAVVFAGETPKYVDAKESSEAVLFAEKCKRIELDQGELLDAMEPYREIEIRRPDGKQTSHFLYQMREEGERRWVFIANGKKPQTQDLTDRLLYRIILSGEWSVEICNTQTGDVFSCHSIVKNGKTELTQILDLHDSLLLHLYPRTDTMEADANLGQELRQDEVQLMDDAAMGQPKRSQIQRWEKELPQPVKFKLEEPNVLLLDQCIWRFDNGLWEGEEEILRIDNEIRDRLAMPKRMEAWPQPWILTEEKVPEHTVVLHYSIESEKEMNQVFLALEQVEDAMIIWNGVPVDKKVCGWYVDKSIKKIVLGKLAVGKNDLVITRPFGEKTNLEWSYLLGDFGVRVAGEKATITELPITINFGDFTAQGLPFYAGNIKYVVEFDAEEGNYGIQISKFRAPLLKLSIDGGDWQRIAYAPYEVNLGHLEQGLHRLELIAYGNRVNAFGTVHNCDETTEWYGPNEWRTEGERFAYEYQIKKMGVLKTPIIFQTFSINQKERL
jgi:hypothetical protein